MSNLLEIRNLYVTVEGEQLLHDVNLTIAEGEVHTLLGPNGSGKTSLMMTIMGFSAYQVTHGQIIFDGQDITELDLTERARQGLSVAQQRPPTIAGVKLRQVLDYAVTSGLQHPGNVEFLVQEAVMEPFLDRDINAGLSGGEIKRSELLQLLVNQPRLAMMDEPDSGIDVVALSLVGNMINDLFSIDPICQVRRRAGLIITHTGQILNYVQPDKAHIMLNGTIACSGNPQLILNMINEHGYEECVRCFREGVWR